MPTFEVTIETPDEGTTLTFVLDAEHWVSAWREGLKIMGVKTPPPNAVCEVGGDESVRISVPDTTDSWLVRPRTSTAAAAEKTAAPARRAQAPSPRSPAVEGYPRVPVNEHLAAPPSTRSGAPHRTAGFPPLTRRPPLAPARPTDEDPLARRLDDSARARLDRVTRRMAVPSVAPSEAPVTRGGRYRSESTKHGHPASGPRTDKPTPDEKTSTYTAMETDAPLLPQQFRAIASPHDGRPVASGPAEQAVENAWQHIPCQLAQTLRHTREGTLEVVAARGERERETLRCRIQGEGAFGRLLSPRPVRVKYSEDTNWLRYVDGRGAEALKLLVRSAACVPIVVGGCQWGVMLLINSTRRSGFAEGELRAVSYLGVTLGRELTTTR